MPIDATRARKGAHEPEERWFAQGRVARQVEKAVEERFERRECPLGCVSLFPSVFVTGSGVVGEDDAVPRKAQKDGTEGHEARRELSALSSRSLLSRLRLVVEVGGGEHVRQRFEARAQIALIRVRLDQGVVRRRVGDHVRRDDDHLALDELSLQLLQLFIEPSLFSARTHDVVHRPRDIKPPVIRKRPQDGVERRLREPRAQPRARAFATTGTDTGTAVAVVAAVVIVVLQMPAQAEERVAHAGKVPALRKEAQQRRVCVHTRREPRAHQQPRRVPHSRGRPRAHGVCEQRRVREDIRRRGRRGPAHTHTCTSTGTGTGAGTGTVAGAHLGKNSKRGAKMFFARPAPALLARTVEQQVPLPPLDDPARIVERAHDRKHLREAAAAARGGGGGGGEEAQEAVAVGEGHLGRGFFCAAREDEERAVGCPGARCVLGVCEDGEQARAEALSAVYTRKRVDGRGGHHRESLEVVRECFEVGRGRCGDARRTFEWETGRCASATKRFDKTRCRDRICRRSVICIGSCPLLLFFSNLPRLGSKGDVLVDERHNGGRRQGLLCRRLWGVVLRL